MNTTQYTYFCTIQYITIMITITIKTATTTPITPPTMGATELLELFPSVALTATVVVAKEMI